MRDDWNERAREDAHYYVAFGRREQESDEFLDSAADVVRNLEGELKRLAPGPAQSRKALEIGCGPGRLMRPMSRHFGEIHGVDVSDEMIARARARLRDIPQAHLHHNSGSDLSMFPDGHFDFVWSYAVFQHIPSAEVVFNYFREILRVLKAQGIARLQINGLPPAKAYTTWDGVRIASGEIHAFTLERGIDLLSLTGTDTQYMWTTWRKQPACRIRSIASSFSDENSIPAANLLSCAAIWIENLPLACELNSLRAFIGGIPGRGCYLGQSYGLSQFNVFLPAGIRTGMLPVRIEWHGRRVCPDGTVRVIPSGPVVPRLVSVSDGIDLISYQRITSGKLKVTIEEVRAIESFAATVDGAPVEGLRWFLTDPLAERYEVDFALPAGTGAGGHVLEMRIGKLKLSTMGIEVVC